MRLAWQRCSGLLRSAVPVSIICPGCVRRHVRREESSPQYNYGLPGKGKGAQRFKRPTPAITVKGEVLFGIHPVTLALSAKLRPHCHALYMDSKHRDSQSTGSNSKAFRVIQDLAVSRQVDVHWASKAQLTQLSGNRPHQGVCLDASPRPLPRCDHQQLLHGVEWSPGLLWLMLYNVQDPMNFGAILRSCHYLGVDRVLVPDTHSCALSPVVSKASSGAMEVMDIVQTDHNYRSLQQLTQMWQRSGGHVVGTTSHHSPPRDDDYDDDGDDDDDDDDVDTTPHSTHPGSVCRLKDFAVSAPTLLLVGNEGRGIDADVMDLCDTLLTIPPPSPPSSTHITPSAVTSLNVSVATGILIHWLRTATPRP